MSNESYDKLLMCCCVICGYRNRHRVKMNLR